MRIQAIFPQFGLVASGAGVFHTLAEELVESGVELRAWYPACDAELQRPWVSEVFPPWAWPVARRLDPSGRLIRACLESAYLRSLEPAHWAYVWPTPEPLSFSAKFFTRVKQRGNTLVLELTHCLTAMRGRSIEEAGIRLGWPVERASAADVAATEREMCRCADYIFCPSPSARKSALDEGIPPHKLLDTTYGWDPRRCKGRSKALEPIDDPTFLSVARLGLREGAPLLLDAWAHAGIKGRLVLVGQLEPSVQARCANLLTRPDVVHIPYAADIAPVYRSADVFVLPTLDEQGPLTVLEAMGNGLPVIVSPMGAGGIVRDGREGISVEPFDRESIVAAIRRLATDIELREAMAAAARIRAGDYTWEEVASRRLDQWQALAHPPREAFRVGDPSARRWIL